MRPVDGVTGRPPSKPLARSLLGGKAVVPQTDGVKKRSRVGPHGAKRNAGNVLRIWPRISLRTIRATLALRTSILRHKTQI